MLPCYRRALPRAQLAAAFMILPTAAFAHGVVGARFFPATMAVEDPLAADELALPTFSQFRHNEDGSTVTETSGEFEYSKTLLPGFALSIGDEYVHLREAGAASAEGWSNVELGATATIIRDPVAEFAASLSLSWEIGGSGGKPIAESASTYTPSFLFGKGLGALPDDMALLRPLAVTGSIGYAIPSRGSERALNWGGAVEYSLPYLQANVRDVGLGVLLSRVTPLVEFSLTTPNHGKTTGTINPGFVWAGQQVQLGLEAVLPLNHETGRNVGLLAQMHFYIDDIFPRSLGTPIWGEAR